MNLRSEPPAHFSKWQIWWKLDKGLEKNVGVRVRGANGGGEKGIPEPSGALDSSRAH